MSGSASTIDLGWFMQGNRLVHAVKTELAVVVLLSGCASASPGPAASNSAPSDSTNGTAETSEPDACRAAPADCHGATHSESSASSEHSSANGGDTSGGAVDDNGSNDGTSPPATDGATTSSETANGATSAPQATNESGESTGSEAITHAPHPTDDWPGLLPRDESTLVEVDGAYVVLKVPDRRNFLGAPARIEVRELGTGVTHALTETSRNTSESVLSPRRDVVFLDDIQSHSGNVQTVLYLTERGYVPPQHSPGYTDETIGGWCFACWNWSADGRFGTIWREPDGGQAYIDMVDAHSGRLLGSVPTADSGGLYSFGGYTFTYAFEEPGRLQHGAISATAEGVWEVLFPAGPGFAGLDGTVYYFDDAAGQHLVKRQPWGDPVELPIPSEVMRGTVAAVSTDGNRLLMVSEFDRGQQLFDVTLGGEAVPLGELHGFLGLSYSETLARDWTLIQLSADYLDTLVAIRSADLHIEVLALDETIPYDYGVEGDHFFFRAENQPLTYVGFDTDDHPVSVEIEGTATAEYLGCLTYQDAKPPATRSVANIDSEHLILVDLSELAAKLVGTIELSQPEASLDCAVWSVDGNSFVYAERTSDETRLFRVVWNESGEPSTPELLIESTEDVTPIGLR